LRTNSVAGAPLGPTHAHTCSAHKSTHKAQSNKNGTSGSSASVRTKLNFVQANREGVSEKRSMAVTITGKQQQQRGAEKE